MLTSAPSLTAQHKYMNIFTTKGIALLSLLQSEHLKNIRYLSFLILCSLSVHTFIRMRWLLSLFCSHVYFDCVCGTCTHAHYKCVFISVHFCLFSRNRFVLLISITTSYVNSDRNGENATVPRERHKYTYSSSTPYIFVQRHASK